MAESFDYIIVGGGTSGLVLANRLSEDADIRVLVIEAGSDQRDNPSLSTPGLIPGAYTHDGFIWPFKSVPQEQLNNRHLRQDTGKVLGGSSLTNFLVVMHPSRCSLDNWKALGNQSWGFDDLSPYLRKFSTFHAPNDALRKGLPSGFRYYQHELTGDGPVQCSFDDDYSILNEGWMGTFTRLGLELKTDPRTGKAVGAFQGASSIEPKSNTRSSAATAYYTPAVAGRPNLKVLMEAHAKKIVTSERDGLVVATGVQFIERDGHVSTASAKKEVIISAGSLRSPQMLELSGIGDRVLLESLGIPVVIENPNVGEHMQDHLMTSQQFPAREGVPSSDRMRDPAVFQKAADEYANTRGGPLASLGISVAYVPLSDKAGVMPSDRRKALFDQYLTGGPSPESTLEREFKLTRALLETQEEPSIQYMCLPGSLTVTPFPDTLTDMFTPTAPYDCIGIMGLLNHPFSRGSVHISSADASAPPTWDPKYCSHPLDVELMARSVQFVDLVAQTAPFADLIDPAHPRVPDLDVDDIEQAREVVRSRTVPCFHICGSCRMLPRRLGGVVDERLRVHGTANLRVVDASIFPLIPLGNIQTTVYAVAERAADLIKEDRKNASV
ncbi:hypothetical protein GGR56DRAFT_590462 [Xylariaceae sp. FL0804]|nr:hypothetical protein GGR56DRAFT_590462 [Xylariaceae sp. FL0804]